MPKAFKRTDRLNKVIHQELSTILHHKFDGYKIAIVQSVIISADMKHASAYISCYTIENHHYDINQIVKQLNDDHSIIRRYLSQACQLRVTPQLHFFADKNLDRARAIDDLIRQ